MHAFIASFVCGVPNVSPVYSLYRKYRHKILSFLALKNASGELFLSAVLKPQTILGDTIGDAIRLEDERDDSNEMEIFCSPMWRCKKLFLMCLQLLLFGLIRHLGNPRAPCYSFVSDRWQKS
jgi:hypothetical protein